MTKLGEQVQNQLRVSDKVVASARTHAEPVSTILAEQAQKVQGPLTKATKSAYLAVFSAMGDGLARAATELGKAEEDLAAERADDGPVRTSRDGAATALAALLGLLRRTIEDHMGEKAVTTYGLSTESPRVPAKLLQYAKTVARLLGEHPAVVTSPLGSTFDTSAALQSVVNQCNQLEAAVGDDDREARELETAFAARDRAAAAWSDVYQGTATALEGLYRLAGYGDLAEKVRPTQRKMRGEEEGAEPPGTEPQGSPTGG
ncbi:hypothetical protein [Polyangium spumosum]|uniref:Uncharacterized protein n=1 Tax=Polyangium spumosum TaxID=889282 RepID=A0A6N7PR47_9BACT|nr:hypothetical protein [Polyangium spumosum]MRG94409.1 hypothetical protein [Polyangium spumosum]